MGYSPFNDGPGEAFWLGVGSAEAIRRQRTLADAVAPGFAAALRAEGPIDGFSLDAQGIAMGDDCHMRHQATTMLLLRQTLPAMAERAPRSVLPTARLLAANGHFALTMTIACARAALAGIAGTPASSLLVFISRNGTDAAVQIAGLPDRWFTAPAPPVGDPLYRPGMSDDDAAPDIGDSALVECCGLGAAASAASPASPPSSAGAWPRRSSGRGRWPTSASARASASASPPSTARAPRWASTPAPASTWTSRRSSTPASSTASRAVRSARASPAPARADPRRPGGARGRPPG